MVDSLASPQLSSSARAQLRRVFAACLTSRPGPTQMGAACAVSSSRGAHRMHRHRAPRRAQLHSQPSRRALPSRPCCSDARRAVGRSGETASGVRACLAPHWSGATACGGQSRPRKARVPHSNPHATKRHRDGLVTSTPPVPTRSPPFVRQGRAAPHRTVAAHHSDGRPTRASSARHHWGRTFRVDGKRRRKNGDVAVALAGRRIL